MVTATRQVPATGLGRSASSRDRQAAVLVFTSAALVAALPAVTLPAPGLWLIAAMCLAAVVLLEPKLGLYGLVAVVAIDAAPFDPLTSGFGKLFSSLPLLELTPAECLILWTCLAALVRGILRQDLVLPPPALMLSLLAFLAFILLAVFQGLNNGGDLIIALWEVRALLAILPVMVATRQLVRGKRDLRELAAVLVVVFVLMTAESFWRYLTYVRPGVYDGALEFAFTHETSLLVGFLVTICTAWSFWGPNRKQKWAAALLGLLAAIVLLTMRRRAGLVAGEAGLICVGLFLLLKDWRRFMFVAPIALLLSAVYLGAFWNNPNSLGQPARAFRSVFESETTDGRDQASDMYRRAEKLNVWWNIQAAPLQGIGFGVPYAKPYRFPDLSAFWPFWAYIPHNTVLWLWMKGGVVPFLAFWFLLGCAMSRVVEVCRSTQDRALIAVCASIAAFITMLVLFSYVDLGLTNTRLLILLGMALGLVGTVEHLVHRDYPSPQGGLA